MVKMTQARPAQAPAALGRPAAAGRAGPGAGEPARRAAARRAARRARPQAAPGDADRAQAPPDPGRHHVHLRDPRPGGGAVDVGPHRGHARRPRRAARRARGDLRPARHRVRRRLHRPAELLRRRRQGRRARAGGRRVHGGGRRAGPTTSSSASRRWPRCGPSTSSVTDVDPRPPGNVVARDARRHRPTSASSSSTSCAPRTARDPEPPAPRPRPPGSSVGAAGVVLLGDCRHPHLRGRAARPRARPTPPSTTDPNEEDKRGTRRQRDSGCWYPGRSAAARSAAATSSGSAPARPPVGFGLAACGDDADVVDGHRRRAAEATSRGRSTSTRGPSTRARTTSTRSRGDNDVSVKLDIYGSNEEAIAKLELAGGQRLRHRRAHRRVHPADRGEGPAAAARQVEDPQLRQPSTLRSSTSLGPGQQVLGREGLGLHRLRLRRQRDRLATRRTGPTSSSSPPRTASAATCRCSRRRATSPGSCSGGRHRLEHHRRRPTSTTPSRSCSTSCVPHIKAFDSYPAAAMLEGTYVLSPGLERRRPGRGRSRIPSATSGCSAGPRPSCGSTPGASSPTPSTPTPPTRGSTSSSTRRGVGDRVRLPRLQHRRPRASRTTCRTTSPARRSSSSPTRRSPGSSPVR